IAGRKVFDGKTSIDVCVQHVTAQPQPLAVEVPRELEALIMECLAKSPGSRPSAAAMAHRLRAIAATDWSEDDAQRWWSEFRTQSQDLSAAGSAPTLTITIDINQRGISS